MPSNPFAPNATGCIVKFIGETSCSLAIAWKNSFKRIAWSLIRAHADFGLFLSSLVQMSLGFYFLRNEIPGGGVN
jgi:hypothetical protein